MDAVETKEGLRDFYAQPIDRARLKTLRQLDRHCRRFLELCPFLCLGTAGPENLDVSPRGDQPGFVRVLDDHTLAIPDWPGNNRLDSLTNLVSDPRVGLLFLIPGVQETLRVNGSAVITMDPAVRSLWSSDGKQPKSALVVTVHEAYLHCGKALIRSKLWEPDYRVDRAQLPTYGCMLKDHTGIAQSADEIDALVNEAYRTKLY